MKNSKISTIVLLVTTLFIASCKKEEKMTCLNGGTSSGNTCNCATGYTGSDCGTEKTPVSMTITSIKLNTHPTDNDGFYWDDFSGMPDIYLSFNSGTTATKDDITNTTDGVQDAHTPTFQVDRIFNSINENLTIGLWDSDPTLDEFMGGLYFKPIDKKSGFPSTINLKSGSIDMTLNVTWNF